MGRLGYVCNRTNAMERERECEIYGMTWNEKEERSIVT